LDLNRISQLANQTLFSMLTKSIKFVPYCHETIQSSIVDFSIFEFVMENGHRKAPDNHGSYEAFNG